MRSGTAIQVIERWRNKPNGTLREQMLRRAFSALGWPYTTRARCAVRFIQLTGCLQKEAAALFGVTTQAVSHVWAGSRKGLPEYAGYRVQSGGDE